MSDEPKRPQAPAWIGWTMVLLFAVYPLSIGPATWIFYKSGYDERFHATAVVVYRPLAYLKSKSKATDELLTRYADLWIP